MTTFAEAMQAHIVNNDIKPLDMFGSGDTDGLAVNQSAVFTKPASQPTVTNTVTRKSNVSKGRKMSAVVFPDLPAELVNSEDDSVGFFLDMIVKSHTQLTELTGVYEKVRESEANAEEALENSDSENAQSWRETQEDAIQAAEAIAEAEKAAIAEIKRANKEKLKEINERLAAERKAAIEKETGAILEDVDLDELKAKYSTALTNHIKAVKLVKEEVPQVVDYLKSLPSEVKQAKGNRSTNNGSGERGPTPRFVYVAVDGTQVEGAQTFSTAVKVLGIKASEGGRKLLADRLQGEVVTFDNISTDINSPSTFTVTTADGVVHAVSVVGKVKTEDTEEAAA
jgi:hypothetical protein